MEIDQHAMSWHNEMSGKLPGGLNPLEWLYSRPLFQIPIILALYSFFSANVDLQRRRAITDAGVFFELKDLSAF